MKPVILIPVIAGLLMGAGSLARQPATPAADPAQPGPPPAPSGDRPPREDRPMRRNGDRPGEPGGGMGGMGAGGPRDGALRDPKFLREFIDRQIEQMSRATKRLEEARTELESGASPEEVFRKLREARAGAMADNFFANWRERQQPGAQGNLADAPQPPGPPEPEQIDELVAFIRENRPGFADVLDKWKKGEPKVFMMVVSRLMHQARDTFRERDRDKQLFELRKEDLRNSVLIVEKSVKLRGLQGEAKGQPESEEFKKATLELRELMGKGYDSRVRVREYEADKLEARLRETRAKIQETKDVRGQLVDKAVAEVLARKRVTPQPGDGPGDAGEVRPPKKGPPPEPPPH